MGACTFRSTRRSRRCWPSRYEDPDGPYSFEPKWDGFRSIIFRDGGEVEIGSRNERPMTRYFPELVAAVPAQFPRRCVIDGEIVVPGRGRAGGWTSRRCCSGSTRRRAGSNLLAEQTPAHFIAFDLLALGDADCTEQPFAQRRAALERGAGRRAAPVHLTPATTDRDLARRWFHQFEGAGLDGLIAKPLDVTYQPDKRVMFKVKHERTADCVVAGYRAHKSGEEAIGSLLLGPVQRRRATGQRRRHRRVPDGAPPGAVHRAPAAGHHVRRAPVELGARRRRGRGPRAAAEHSRWNATKDLSFTPLRPERVVEVRYDHMEGPRFRHTAQFVRWRPDRDPRSCTYEQLEEPVSFDLAEVLAPPA